MPAPRETILATLHAAQMSQPAPVLRSEVLPGHMPARRSARMVWTRGFLRYVVCLSGSSGVDGA
jgi:hypothetical protein